MTILQIMGCTSDQYGSMEQYLVAKAQYLHNLSHKLIVAYENIPKSKEFIQDFKYNGGELIYFKFRSSYNFENYFSFYKLIKNKKIKILHTYFSPACYYAALVGRFAGIRKIYRTAANLPLSLHKCKGFVDRSLYILSRRIFTEILFNKVFCRSKSVYEEYRAMGIPEKQLEIVDGGVNTNIYRKRLELRNHYRSKYGILPSEIAICSIGRLVPIKRFDILIEAVNLIKKNIKFCIIGDGPLREALRNRIYEYGLTEKVYLLGHFENISDILNIFDIFISCSNSEGMSNAILEAMATEIPVVLSNIPPHREFFDEANKRGLVIGELFENNSPEDLASKIEKLLDNPPKLKHLGLNCRHLVEQRYSLSRRIEKELHLYGLI